jgi:serine/threonine-protein kinase RsbW
VSGYANDFSVANDLSILVGLRARVTEAVRLGGFPENYINRLLIAVDEAVTNIIEHAYEGVPPGAGRIDISLAVTPDEFRITVSDQGETFDPRQLSDVDIQRHVASGRNGGLGVFLIRKIMDTVDYHHESGVHNRLTMVKRR